MSKNIRYKYNNVQSGNESERTKEAMNKQRTTLTVVIKARAKRIFEANSKSHFECWNSVQMARIPFLWVLVGVFFLSYFGLCALLFPQFSFICSLPCSINAINHVAFFYYFIMSSLSFVSLAHCTALRKMRPHTNALADIRSDEIFWVEFVINKLINANIINR